MHVLKTWPGRGVLLPTGFCNPRGGGHRIKLSFRTSGWAASQCPWRSGVFLKLQRTRGQKGSMGQGHNKVTTVRSAGEKAEGDGQLRPRPPKPLAGTTGAPRVPQIHTHPPPKTLATASTHLFLWGLVKNHLLLRTPPTQARTEVGVGREKQRAKHAGLTHRGPYQTENVCSNPPS